MWTLTSDEVTRVIAADPATLYAVVSDVTRTPELSPEILSCEWLGDSGPMVGARFRARNKVTRGPAWSNEPEVIAADPDREFAFRRRERPAGELVWRYRFEPTGTGTRVTESYQVTKPVPRAMCWAMRWIWGSKDRPAELRAGMAETLRRLAAATEQRSSIEQPSSIEQASTPERTESRR